MAALSCPVVGTCLINKALIMRGELSVSTGWAQSQLPIPKQNHAAWPEHYSCRFTIHDKSFQRRPFSGAAKELEELVRFTSGTSTATVMFWVIDPRSCTLKV